MILSSIPVPVRWLACAAFAATLTAAPACDPSNGGITLPPGFCALLVADNLGPARHLAVAPNGDVFVALQADGKQGGVVALHDSKGDGHFDVKEHFGQDSLTGIVLRNGYLYVAGFHDVLRYKLAPGQLKPDHDPEIIVTGLPGEEEHGDKGLAFDNKGSLYVNVGAPSNACQEQNRKLHSPGLRTRARS